YRWFDRGYDHILRIVWTVYIIHHLLDIDPVKNIIYRFNRVYDRILRIVWKVYIIHHLLDIDPVKNIIYRFDRVYHRILRIVWKSIYYISFIGCRPFQKYNLQCSIEHTIVYSA